MTEDHARVLIEKYKGKLFGWNVKYPLPEWVCVWLKYWEELDVLHEKYKDYVIPDSYHGGRTDEEQEYYELSQTYFYNFLDLFMEYKQLHPEEFINETHERALVGKYQELTCGWKLKFPLPKWLCIWWEYFEQSDFVFEKYRDVKLPNRRDGGLEPIELRFLANL